VNARIERSCPDVDANWGGLRSSKRL